MGRRLTAPRRRRLSERPRVMPNQAQLRHVGLLGHQPPDWLKTKWVSGITEDVTLTRIRRGGVGCGLDVYTSVRSPDDVPIVCEVCLYQELIKKESTAA